MLFKKLSFHFLRWMDLLVKSVKFQFNKIKLKNLKPTVSLQKIDFDL